jgi:ferrous iron transport protein B
MTLASPPPATVPAVRRIALAGNPNAGKTTLFNRLTGRRAKVANYPGVTVEIESGTWDVAELGRVDLVDVPGSYSLSAHSAEERVAIEAIAGLPPSPLPDAVVVVADATELARHLYLVLQIRELDLPTVVALTMVDRLEALGRSLDLDGMALALGVPVVPVVASQGRGIAELGAALRRVIDAGAPARRAEIVVEPQTVRADVEAVAVHVPEAWHRGDRGRARALARWALLSADEPAVTSGLPRALVDAAERHRHAAQAADRDLDAEIVGARYDWIDRHIDRLVRNPPGQEPRTWTDRLDAVFLHPFVGFAVFVAVMTVVFQSLFVGADPFIGWIEDGVAALSGAASDLLPAGLFRDFVVDALIEGVGSVLVFLPQILLMFLFLGILEDSGYMARVVFLMDRVMKAVGLHGRAFVPMMTGFACAVPAILATRTMERRRDRVLTMMVVPLMTCSARLPVYGLMIAALYPIGSEQPFAQGLLMAAMYLFSIAIALAAAAVLGRTVLKGRHAPLILQMPPYRRPQLGSVWRMMSTRAGIFLREAGTVILVCTIGLWILLAFPRTAPDAAAFAAQRAAVGADAGPEQLVAIDAEEQGSQIRHSFAGRLGRGIEPAIAPLGFDWQIGVGLIGAFAAREVFVSTMAVVYGLGDAADETSRPLRDRIRSELRPDGRRVFTPLTCLSLMVFFALACQCMSTLAAVRREAGGWAWPAFLFGYMSVLAWLASFAVYQGGHLLGFE